MCFQSPSEARAELNTNEQRSRSGLCERQIRREATETKGLVNYKYDFYFPIFYIQSFGEQTNMQTLIEF